MTDYTFDQLVNIQFLQRFLESHQILSKLSYSLFDADGNMFIAVGWQDLCVRFFRVNPITSVCCRESEAFIKAHLHDFTGEFLEYRCKNGMTLMVMPIITDGRHVATFFVSQFFYDDDRPDMAQFRRQAEEFGFDNIEFLTALDRVPVLSREQVRSNILFMQNVVQALADMGMKRLETAREIKKRKRAEEELAIAEFTLNQIHEAAFLMDEQGQLHYVNEAACRSLGYSRDHLFGLSIPDIDPDYPVVNIPHVFTQLQTQGTRTFETRNRTKDGRIFPVEITSNIFEHGGVKYILSLARDITERKQLELNILAYQEQLRSMASEISFVEERERHKIATALHDQVGQPLAMAAIKLETLRKADISGNLDRQFAEILDMIRHSLRDSRTLTFELSPPILYDLGLEAAIFSLAERYQKEHGIRIDCSDDRHPKPLSDDMRVLLFQGVRELLVNAVKHAHARRITISCQREGTDIRIMVKDDGVGFDTGELNTSTGKSGGFGLFSLRERLRYLGGSIDITSSPGSGTQVILAVPLMVETEKGEMA
jgi:PAS domain S-box-containing protein